MIRNFGLSQNAGQKKRPESGPEANNEKYSREVGMREERIEKITSRDHPSVSRGVPSSGGSTTVM